MKFYIYLLKSSIDDKILYIGKGSGKRMYKHVQIAKGNSTNRKRNPHLYNTISKIISNNGYIKYEIVFETDIEDYAYIKEKEFIDNIGIDNLCNICDGGLGGLIGEWTDERKKKLSNSKKGKPRSEEAKKSISESLKGKPTGRSYWKGKELPEETKEKMRQSGKGKNSGPISEKRRLAIIEGIRRKKEERENSLSQDK
jgi:hypothetical protein